MDVDWFKQKQKQTGVTSYDVGQALGRDRTILARFYSGRQKMTYEQAEKFAELFSEPLDEVLLKSGITKSRNPTEIIPLVADGDAAPWSPEREDEKEFLSNVTDVFAEGRQGLQAWRVKTRAMALAGLLANDMLLVDTSEPHTAKSGDVVVAQVYDWWLGSAVTVLRRYDHPTLVSASADPQDWKSHIVDENNVIIKGIVVASWRQKYASIAEEHSVPA
ncbi:MAG: hypothetical protein AAF753_11605 [Pseudomonadota bacterium]